MIRNKTKPQNIIGKPFMQMVVTMAVKCNLIPPVLQILLT